MTSIFRSLGVWGKRCAIVGGISLAAALIGSCGGQGVSSDTGLRVGDLSILPSSGSLYAFTPHEFTIAGGRRPYTVSSNEPSLLPVSRVIEGNNFVLVPNNPGVTDLGQDPKEVPSRTVIMTVRDNVGTQINATYKVLQNFFTGYSIGLNSISTCGLTGADVVVQGCAGFESIVQLRPTQAGNIRAQRALRLTNNHGDFAFIDTTTNRVVNSVTVTTDFGGDATAHIFVNPNAFTHYASFRVTDVASGLYIDHEFLILSAPLPAASPMTLLPATVTLQGGFTGQCGVGSIDVLISGGVPPYAITAASQNVSITPSVVTTRNGIFRATANNQSQCLTAELGTIVVRDSGGNAPVTFTLITTQGTAIPPTPLTVVGPTPAACMANTPATVPPAPAATPATQLIAISGGNAAKVLSVSDPSLILAAPTAGTGAFLATLTSQGTASATGTTVVVTVTDGASTGQATVLRKATCP